MNDQTLQPSDKPKTIHIPEADQHFLGDVPEAKQLQAYIDWKAYQDEFSFNNNIEKAKVRRAFFMAYACALQGIEL